MNQLIFFIFSKDNHKAVIFKLLLLIVFIVVSFLITSISIASAVTYYVATNGTDNSSCGSTTSPCASIQYVLANKVAAGDTVKIKAGTYNITSTIKIDNPTKYANITITADDPNNRPLLDFGGISGGIRIGYYDSDSPAGDIRVPGVTISYLRLKGGPARDWNWDWIIRVDGSELVTIDHNEIFNTYSGIVLNVGKNAVISNNKIYTMGPFETDPNQAYGNGDGIAINNFGRRNAVASGWNEKIYIYNNEVYDAGADGIILLNCFYKYIEIAYNNLHNNYEDGIDLKDSQYVRIHDNKLHDNWGDGIGSNNDYPSTDFGIWNNEIYKNGWLGISIQGGSNDQKNWKIWNNLIYGNANNPPTWSPVGVQLNGSGHEFYHNVVYDNKGNYGLSGGGIIKNNIFFNNVKNISSGGTVDHNYIYPTSGSTLGTNSITVSDPKMTNPANANFILLSSSPLIDAGINVGITTDYIGAVRPQGAGYDIGAYEYPSGGSGDITPPSAPTGVTVS